MSSRRRCLAQYRGVVRLSGGWFLSVLDYEIDQKTEDDDRNQYRKISEEGEERVELDLGAGDCHPRIL